MLKIDRLEQAVPALGLIKSAQPRTLNWAAVSAELGTGLPQDFMELAERYPAFIMADFLSLHLPDPGEEVGFVRGMKETFRSLAELHEEEMTEGYVPYPEPGGLIPWGDSAEGDNFYWHTGPDGPDSWTVVVETRNGYWGTYDGTLTEYLTGLVTGTVEPDGLPPDFPGENPTVIS
ncbi:SMI1/KNR4 family protein [Streptomyces gardneri]|uniref:SMI1/KNR4 family protein n=1 Tax=Streptomyces gardneri TaxID=66892 RepID=UPI0036A7DA0A